MKLHTNPLNDAGQQVMEIHREYHNPDIPELHKSALLALASERLGKQKLAWKKAFCNPDPLDLVSLLAKKADYQAGEESLRPDVENFVSQVLSQTDIHEYDIGFMRNQRKVISTVYIERRIGLKASHLAKLLSDDINKIHTFFDLGHAEAIVKTLLYPAVANLFSDMSRSQNAKIHYGFSATRKYFFNLQIRFFMEFPEKLTEENIMSIGECLKKIDDFKKANPMYF